MFFKNTFLAIWHGFPDITHIEVNNGHKSAIFNLIKWKFLKPHICSIVMVSWHGFPHIIHI